MTDKFVVLVTCSTPAEAQRIAKAAGNDDKAQFDAILKWVRANIQSGTDARTLDDVWFSRSGSGTQMSLLAREMAQALLHQRLGLTVAEVDHHDLWQRATLAGALVSGSMTHLHDACDGVQRFLDARFPQGVRMERVFASFGDVEGLG